MMPPLIPIIIPCDTLIAKQWRVKRKIGSGSFGEIYEGQDARTNDKLAIKVVTERDTNHHHHSRIRTHAHTHK